jgi:protein-tyrosine phosphatase
MSIVPAAAQRHLAFDRLHNFRDFGGYPTADGQSVAWGRLYRADSLGKLTGADLTRFGELGIRTVIDLRHSWEGDTGGRVPGRGGLAYHNYSIEHRPYDQGALSEVTDPVRFLADRYAEVADDGVAEITATLRVIAAPGSAPLVIHCASGKDRTGMIAAMVLSLLGVSTDDIVADYALTGLATERLVADWRAFYPGRELTWPHYGTAPAGVMQLFLAELADRFGSVREYLTGPVGLAENEIGQLRSRYLTPASAAEPAEAGAGG